MYIYCAHVYVRHAEAVLPYNVTPGALLIVIIAVVPEVVTSSCAPSPLGGVAFPTLSLAVRPASLHRNVVRTN